MGIARSQMNRQLYADGMIPEVRGNLEGIRQLQQPVTGLETVVGDAVKMVIEATGIPVEKAIQAVGKIVAKIRNIDPRLLGTGDPQFLARETMKELAMEPQEASEYDEEVTGLMKGLRPQTSNEEFMTKMQERENLLRPGEYEGEGYTGSPDMYPDYAEDVKEQMANGGIMSLNRQGYFLGGIGRAVSKAVKGVTKTVKSIASSDIGKLALTAAAIYAGGGGFTPGGFSLFGNAAGGAGLLGSGGQFGLGKSFLGSKLLGAENFIGEYEGGPFSGITNLLTGRSASSPTSFLKAFGGGKGSILSSSVLPFMAGSVLGSTVSGGGEKDDTQVVDQSKQVSDWTTRLRERLQGPYDYTTGGYKNYNPMVMAADGGRIGYAYGSVDQGIMAAPQIANMMGMPVGNPRQNQQGVAELDYRDEGGFVPPIGVKERADDIPAMLSNNEFVFNAKSVKNADPSGNQDPEEGAKVMYALMKRLENGGMV